MRGGEKRDRSSEVDPVHVVELSLLLLLDSLDFKDKLQRDTLNNRHKCIMPLSVIPVLPRRLNSVKSGQCVATK
jgi:hypothetical protein